MHREETKSMEWWSTGVVGFQNINTPSLQYSVLGQSRWQFC
jgi:hypothetical protein